MTSWILILTLISSNGTAVESIKQIYTSEQACNRGGDAWHKQIDSAFKDADYACIPNL